MRHWLRKSRPLWPLLMLIDRIIGGGEVRLRLLLALLDLNRRTQLRRDWVFSTQPPAFFDPRLALIQILNGASAYGLYRGYYAAEVIRQGDSILDIGCGDGFFDKRFFAERAGRIDAIDVEPKAIESARRRNAAPNIRYLVQDAVRDDFPAHRYDVIIWDGALGHFAPQTSAFVLEKIRDALRPGGVFVGSEALGFDGDDHLQFFGNISEIASLMRGTFKFVQLREIRYRFPESERHRTEAFWRCAVRSERLASSAWQDFSDVGLAPAYSGHRARM